jgi:hypothetical protein
LLVPENFIFFYLKTSSIFAIDGWNANVAFIHAKQTGVVAL